MIGRPVTAATDSAAPPRASPSSLVSTTPLKPTPSRKALGGGDGVLADHRVDDEQDLVRLDRVADVGGLLHQLGVDAEPAGGVDDHDVVLLLAGVLGRRRARPRPGRRAGRDVAGGRVPGCGAKTATPARSPTTCSWSTALGRCRSAATSSGVWPCSLSQRPSLPARVVLPAPCRPASRMTVGGVFANASRRVSPPSTGRAPRGRSGRPAAPGSAPGRPPPRVPARGSSR